MTAHPPRLRAPEEIARAQRRMGSVPAAQRLTGPVLTLADRWAAFDDDFLRSIVPPPEVPRAFNSSFEGCPVHGRRLFEHGQYSWRFDPFSAPWKLVCPVGGEVYPSNDFAAYLVGGMRDRSLLTGPYADDGWGWQPPGDPHKHWFIAYYCHWLWLNHLIPATLALARSHLLTGEPRYAHKAGVLLARIAEDYPRMDINRQSRYATEFVPSYTGKIANAIWETALARDLAEAWDAVCLAVAADPALGSAAVELIERNLLREALAAIPQRRILGNYGMHQESALYLALALDDPAQAAATLRDVFHGWPGLDGFQYEGALDVLANLFSAEGISYETAPGYCSIPSELLPKLFELAARLGEQAGDDVATKLTAEQANRLCALVQWPPRLVCLGQWTPAIGDSGGAAPPAIVDVSPAALRAAYGQTGDPAIAARLRAASDGPDEGIRQFVDLFAEPPAGPAPSVTVERSDVLTDYGLAILRSGTGATAVAATVHYGRANAGHAHADRLNLELFGAGRKLIPDLGYPQFAAEEKTANAWDRNTGSHTLVVVDGQRQQSQNGGRLLLFARSPWLQAVTADAPAYGDVDVYRRTTLLVGDGVAVPAYAVDLFRVSGGRRHDYRLHGPDLPCLAEGIAWGDEQPGTLAGHDVPPGQLWDDPELERAQPARPFGSYAGCGDSFLYGVRSAETPVGTWRVDWGDANGLRVHLPPMGLSTAFLAWADVPRRPGNPARLRHLILRREGPARLDSAFAAVLEPVVGAAGIATVERLDAGPPGQVALRVRHAGGSDVILSSDAAPLRTADIELDGRLAVIRYNGHGAPTAAYLHGRSLRAPGLALDAASPLWGRITELGAGGRELRIELAPDSPAPALVASQLSETVLTIAGSHQCALVERAAASGDHGLHLTLDRPNLAGQLAVERTEGATVTTRTTLYPPFRGRDDIGAHLEGTWLVLDGRSYRVRAVRSRGGQGHVLVLDGDVVGMPGATATLLAWQVGAEVWLEPAVWWGAG